MELRKNYMRYVNEVDRIYKGHRYIVRLMETGYRNGYVQVSEYRFRRIENDFRNYNFDRIKCRGGITFVEEIAVDSELANFFPEGFWIGFDCHHACDKPDYETALKFFGQSTILMMENELVAYVGGSILSSQEVEEQCVSIIDQLESGIYD